MIPNSFQYKKASSVSEALSMMDDDSQILGGGHSLIPAMKLRLNSPETLIDISKIDSIRGIKLNEKSISIGAGTTHAEIAASDILAEHAPMFVQAASEIGDIQVRNVGTIGGSMAHADPAADWPAVLVASDAQVIIQSSEGSREVDIDQFFTGFYGTALQRGEIITSIRVPLTAGNRHSAYAKFKQPASRFAIVGCAVAADMDGTTVNEIRIGMTGLSESAFRVTSAESALKGQALSEASINGLDGDVTEGTSVMYDHYASVKYRTHLGRVFMKRALKKLL